MTVVKNCRQKNFQYNLSFCILQFSQEKNKKQMNKYEK